MTLDLTRIALQTQRDLQQQSNIELPEIPEDAYIVRKATANQNFPANTNTGILFPTVVLQNRITAFSNTQIVVPDTGFYAVTISMWWTGNPRVYYGWTQSGNTVDIGAIGESDVQNCTVGSIHYFLASTPISILANPTTTVLNNAVFGRPLLKVKKL